MLPRQSVWFTPTVTVDRALLIGIWTSYIIIGSWLKDRRLEYYLGASYRQYEAEVPGYPGMIFGPLARIALPPQAPEENSPITAMPQIGSGQKTPDILRFTAPVESAARNTVETLAVSPARAA